MAGRIVASLTALGWSTAVEVTYARYGERGSIDVLAFRPDARSLLVVELKTELTSLEETLRRLDQKVRLGPSIAAEHWDGGRRPCRDSSSCRSRRRLDDAWRRTLPCFRLLFRRGASRCVGGWSRRREPAPRSACCHLVVPVVVSEPAAVLIASGCLRRGHGAAARAWHRRIPRLRHRGRVRDPGAHQPKTTPLVRWRDPRVRARVGPAPDYERRTTSAGPRAPDYERWPPSCGPSGPQRCAPRAVTSASSAMSVSSTRLKLKQALPCIRRRSSGDIASTSSGNA